MDAHESCRAAQQRRTEGLLSQQTMAYGRRQGFVARRTLTLGTSGWDAGHERVDGAQRHACAASNAYSGLADAYYRLALPPDTTIEVSSS